MFEVTNEQKHIVGLSLKKSKEKNKISKYNHKNQKQKEGSTKERELSLLQVFNFYQVGRVVFALTMPIYI